MEYYGRTANLIRSGIIIRLLIYSAIMHGPTSGCSPMPHQDCQLSFLIIFTRRKAIGALNATAKRQKKTDCWPEKKEEGNSLWLYFFSVRQQEKAKRQGTSQLSVRDKRNGSASNIDMHQFFFLLFFSSLFFLWCLSVKENEARGNEE